MGGRYGEEIQVQSIEVQILGPQIRLEDGSIAIEIYGGWREIGGNCIVIRDRDRKLVFDNGVRFSVLRRYYGRRIQPLGINELRSLGAIPPIDVFEDADAIYISHFHLDHLGLLGSIPPGAKVYVPSKAVLETIEEWYRASPTWLAEIPHRIGVEVEEMRPYEEDGNSVTAIPVSHSAYPAYALLYRGSDRVVFYSGDLRVNSPLGMEIDSLGNIEKAMGSGGVDIALLEGTNIGDIETPIGSEEFRNMLSRLAGHGLLIVSIDRLDFELYRAVRELASLYGMKAVIASPHLLDIIAKWPLEGHGDIYVAADLEKPAGIPASYVSIRDDILRSPGEYILLQDPADFLKMLRQLRILGDMPEIEATAILTTPEPLEPWTEVEEKTLATWLHSLGIQTYRIRVSGHYYPHELKAILKTLNPKKLIPIHTAAPNTMLALFNKHKH